MSIYTPIPAKIVKISQLFGYVKIFKILPQKPIRFEPGQFIMLSLFPDGEAAFTPCSKIDEDGSFEIAVNLVGKLTKRLHNIKEHTYVGIRGGFGIGFPVKKMLNSKNVIIIAGGIGVAPLRYLMQVLLSYNNHPKIYFSYSIHTPSKLLFADEFKGLDIESHILVSHPNSRWRGEVGRATDILEKLQDVCKNSTLAVCGPPPMFLTVEKIVKSMPIDTKNIFFSLERKMRCGVGKCGHCYMGSIQTCTEGPVISLDEIERKHLHIFREYEPFLTKFRDRKKYP